MPTGRWRTRGWAVLLVIVIGTLSLLQYFSAQELHDTLSAAQTASNAVQSDAAVELAKSRQELIAKLVENDSKGRLVISLATGLSAVTAALTAIFGVLVAVSTYTEGRRKEEQDRRDALRKELESREKDRQDRLDAAKRELDAREKERLDRLAAALNQTLDRLVSTDTRQQIVGTGGLLPYLMEDRRDFHIQVLTATLAAARFPNIDPAVYLGIRLAIERAAQALKADQLTAVSWRGVRLPGVNLTGAKLAGIDLRDAKLENARLSGADLTGATLTNAGLQGAQLDGAVLRDADLSYADLAGATLARAELAGANLSNLKVLSLDLEAADLRGIGPGWRGVPWDATRNWRQAQLDEPVRRVLTDRYGEAMPQMRVLMLLWEIPPMVAGGTWTACYHLVRNLRRRGADVTIVVPWRRSTLLLDPPPFGVDVPVVALGIEVPTEAIAGDVWSPYGGVGMPVPYAAGGSGGWSPYGGQPAYAGWSPYGGYSGWSPYGGGGALWSGYTGPSYGGYSGWSPYGGSGALWSGYTGPAGPSYGGGPYGGANAVYGAGALSGSVLHRLIKAFARRLAEYVADQPLDLIHAHDWVTFDAARAAAGRIGVPWIAHFHSTEADRQPDRPDPLTERIEEAAIADATRVVAVSEATRRRLVQAYDRNGRSRIDVVPNSLSEGAASTAEMGRFEGHRVVFLGRLSRQKGVDRFCEVADRVRQAGFTADFVAYGDGPERYQLWRSRVEAPGALGWDKRGSAFRAASAVLVPSRAEPFGMVVLEAMQHRVPVIYPAESGAAEVLENGIKIAGGDTAGMAAAIMRLLGDLNIWEEAVEAAAREIERYPDRRFEDRLIAVWREVVSTRRSISTQ